LAWIPAIAAANRNCCRSNKKGVIIGLILSVFLGIMFFFFFGLRGSPMMSNIPWIFISSIGVFLILIVVMALAATNMASPKNPYNKEQAKHIQKGNQRQLQFQQLNPYKTQKSTQVQFIVEDNKDNQFRNESPFIQETGYCSFCGVELEPNARFCQQCGSKLFS
jgi:hypothetical protein